MDVMTTSGVVPVRGADGLVWDEPGRFRVRTDAYTDERIFQREMRNIFERVWVYVAHESELPGPGAYTTAHVGVQPVIVSRDDDDQIHVLVNRCLHRGSVVCRDRKGTANLFRCPYHGWLYRNNGELAGVAMRSVAGGYGEDFEEPDGLFALPRVDSYRGFIFASFNPDVPPLLEHLGAAKGLIDAKLDESPVGRIVLASDPYVGQYAGNWKFQAENIIDGYHFSFVHEGFVKIQERYKDSTGDFGVHETRNAAAERKFRAKGVNIGTRQGHGLTFKDKDEIEQFFEGQFADYYRGLYDTYGEAYFRRLMGMGVGSIFPNLGLIHHQVRVWRPLAPDRTEVVVTPYELEGAPAGVNEGWLRSQERFYGPSGHGQPDDVEIFSLNQQGLAGRAVEWLILERALSKEHLNPDGDHEGPASGEVPQRGFWRRWAELMEAD